MGVKDLLSEQDADFVNYKYVIRQIEQECGEKRQDAASLVYRVMMGLIAGSPKLCSQDKAHGVQVAKQDEWERACEFASNMAKSGHSSVSIIDLKAENFGHFLGFRKSELYPFLRSHGIRLSTDRAPPLAAFVSSPDVVEVRFGSEPIDAFFEVAECGTVTSEMERLKAEVERLKAELDEDQRGANTKGHERHAPELEIAAIAWGAAVSAWSKGEQGDSTPLEFIKGWVLRHYPDVSGEAAGRIATVANWDKKPGRKPKGGDSK